MTIILWRMLKSLSCNLFSSCSAFSPEEHLFASSQASQGLLSLHSFSAIPSSLSQRCSHRSGHHIYCQILFRTSVLSSVTPGKTAPFALFIEYEAWIDCNPKIAF